MQGHTPADSLLLLLGDSAQYVVFHNAVVSWGSVLLTHRPFSVLLFLLHQLNVCLNRLWHVPENQNTWQKNGYCYRARCVLVIFTQMSNCTTFQWGSLLSFSTTRVLIRQTWYGANRGGRGGPITSKAHREMGLTLKTYKRTAAHCIVDKTFVMLVFLLWSPPVRTLSRSRGMKAGLGRWGI